MSLSVISALSQPESRNLIVAPLVYRLEEDLEKILFPVIKPYDEGYLKVSALHRLWYAQFGNPQGIPVVVVHGGPGFGCSPRDMRFFDPNDYRIILFDQRGAFRSQPFGEMRENTTQDLIADMEKLRQQMAIEKWLLFGGSWGSALSVLYGEAHPDRCLGFILRGIFLATQAQAQQVWYGMRDHYPEVWEEFVSFLPENERGDLLAAFSQRINHPDPQIHIAAARAFMKYDLSCAFALQTPPLEVLTDEKLIVGTTRAFVHYCTHNFFLRDHQLLEDLPRTTHLPALIVQGRFDTICRPLAAYTLHQRWPGSQLVMVQDAGHSAAEPGIAKSLVKATHDIKSLL